MSKVIQFQHPDGKVLTLTQDPNDATVWHSSFEDGSSLADHIKAEFEAGNIHKSK